MNKGVIFFFIHIPVWIFVCLFGLGIVYNSIEAIDTPNLIVTTCIFSLWLLGSFYGFYYWLVPKYLEKGKYKRFVGYALLAAFVIIPIDQLLNWLVFYYTGGLGQPVIGKGNVSLAGFTNINIAYIYAGSVVGTLVCGGLGTFYKFSVDWFKNQQIKSELENKHLLSELNTLKSKLNPHLLFNTLNNIDALIQSNPEQASIALSQLSDILRYVVYDTENEKVPIQKEIRNIQKYIGLEKMRIIHPDSVEFISNVSNETIIPPMIFFPFIENGFKHSNLNVKGQKLKISILEEGNKILFHCSNTINEYRQNEEASGMGLTLSKKRLDLLFPGTHTLNISRLDNEFHVNLKIQLA